MSEIISNQENKSQPGTGWDDLAEEVPFNPNPEKAIADKMYENYTSRYKELYEKQKDGEDVDPEELGSYPYLANAVVDAESNLRLPENEGKTIRDLFAEKSAQLQKRLELWNKNGKFPPNWEQTMRERDWLDAAQENYDAVKQQL